MWPWYTLQLLFIDVVTVVTRLLASLCVQTLRQINVILSRHSEFEKIKQTVKYSNGKGLASRASSTQPDLMVLVRYSCFNEKRSWPDTAGVTNEILSV